MEVPTFSRKTRSLWAKKSRSGDLLWLSLLTHLADTAEVASRLWRRWVPEGVKRTIAAGMSTGDDAGNVFIFLATAHDIGKATPAFASKECGYGELDERIFEQMLVAALPLERQSYFISRGKTPHALASQILLREAGCPESVAVILGAHHGKPPDVHMLEGGSGTYSENFYVNKAGRAVWQAVQRELIEFALRRSGYGALTDLPELGMASQVLLSGLLVTADWIASDTDYFPYVRLDDPVLPDSRQRAANAWAKLGFTLPWEAKNNWMRVNLYEERFDVGPPNRIQEAVMQAMRRVQTPGIVVLEAPMGTGKTEAALVAAEIFADMTKRRGVFFALPTQATSDGIFPRMLEWVANLPKEEAQSIRLLHGKAQFNPAFPNLANGTNIDVDEEFGVYVHEWFTGRKRALLDDFVVGTIDQLLLAALKQKHVMLRHLGLANKVVIIDECHAYDAYMNCYLERALNWLGAYRVPVIVLSATLPAEKRQAVVEAYCNRKFQAVPRRAMSNPLNKNAKSGPTHQNEQAGTSPEWITNRAYPLITCSDGGEIRQTAVPLGASTKRVDVEFLDDEAIAIKLAELLMDGGCAGVIVNSVRRAQEWTRILKTRFGEDAVYLLHSRFLAPDRISREGKLMEELGKPRKGRKRPALRIIVGTQVLEQSLDIDFDVLITDICPMDLLLQRIGRLHRHDRQRPSRLQQALCLITGVREDGFEKATTAIYGNYLLMRTKERLLQQLLLPEHISELVQDVYDGQKPLVPDSDAYRQAAAEYNDLLKKKRQKADGFRMNAPHSMECMIGWLNTDVSDKSGEATVRDTEDSIEVLLVRKTAAGKIGFLPWIKKGMELNSKREPEAAIAQQLACCSVRLPAAVCGRYGRLHRTIQRLEQLNRDELGAWQQSPWLRGELFLILDEQLSVEFEKFRITYHPDYGLEYEAGEVEADRDDQ